MYYSDSDDEIEYSRQNNLAAIEESSVASEEIEVPFYVPEPSESKLNHSPSRPQSARTTAQTKALQLQEKRKAARTNSATGMVVASDAPRPSSSQSSSSLNSDKLFEKRGDIKDLIKERNQKLTDAEKDLLARGIQPFFDPSLEKVETDINKPVTPLAGPKVTLDTTDIRSFLFKTPPKGVTIRCRIEREKGADKLHPSFYVYLEENNQFLIAARKRKKSKTSNYLISMEKSDMNRSSSNYMGKVRSNFVGTEFTMYDKGEAPESVTGGHESGVRQETGAVIYSSNVLGMKGPRKMRVIIPTVNEEGQRTVWKPMKSEEGMVARYKAGDLKNMFAFQNKAPVWNEQTKSFMLNFKNRVKEASVKNFQIVSPEEVDSILMQFGRVSKGVFSMDYSWPFCLAQAFGIALTSFDNKLACE